MQEHSFTPALLLAGVLLGTSLACLEMLWLKRPFHFAGSWAGLSLVGAVNIAFIYVMVAIRNSYFFLLVFPLPVIPAVYILLKVSTYYAVQRLTHSPVQSPWALSFLSLVLHPILCTVCYMGFTHINPTRANLETAIRQKDNRRLELMLWMSIKREPVMTGLVNEAIVYGNGDAVQKLIRHGADPNRDYWLREADGKTLWLITKWMLDRGVKPAEFGVSQGPDFAHIAVSFGVAELEYCIRKGFNPQRHPGILYAAIAGHPLGDLHAISPQAIESLKGKIALLLSHGADINGPGDMAFTPIFALLMIRADLSPVLEFLLERGASVNSQSRNKLYPPDSGELPAGLTPLMLAVIDKHPGYVEILLSRGADKRLRDANGRTALDYAVTLNAGDRIKSML